MKTPVEYILTMGYYPDLFAEQGLPPDLFFHHVRHGAQFAQDCDDDAGLGAARHRCLMILCEAMEDCIDAVKDKYHLDTASKFSRPFNVQDCMWGCEPLPEIEDEPLRYESLDDVPRYVGADDEYPVNPC